MSQNETERTLHARFEDGAVYTQEVNNQFLVIINQAALLDLLDESDCEQLSDSSEKIICFSTLAERDLYLNRRFNNI